MCKKNIIENLESGNLSYVTVGKFLSDLKEGFGERDNELIKMAKLEKVEQGKKTIEEFVQEFRKVDRESSYKEKLLVKNFKRDINGVIRQKPMESEHSP